MKNKILLPVLFCFSLLSFSQEKVVEGKVSVPGFLEGIKVENINTEISVQTDENGTFSIIANVGEVLVFSSVNIERKILFLKDEHFENPVNVELKTTTIEIEEVEVGGNRIDIGLEGKELTPAERKYQSGGKIVNLNQGLEINLEAVGNLFSGKRKELKKSLEIEEINKLLYATDAYFDSDFYLSLGLTPEYIADFKYFLVDDEDFRELLKSENEAEIILKAISLYESYEKIKTDEK